MTINIFERTICKYAMKAKPLENYLIYVSLLSGIALLITSMQDLLYFPIPINNFFDLGDIIGQRNFSVLGALFSIFIMGYSTSDFVRYGLLKNTLLVCTFLIGGIATILYGIYFLNFTDVICGICISAGVVITISYVFHVTEKCPKINQQ